MKILQSRTVYSIIWLHTSKLTIFQMLILENILHTINTIFVISIKLKYDSNEKTMVITFKMNI